MLDVTPLGLPLHYTCPWVVAVIMFAAFSKCSTNMLDVTPRGLIVYTYMILHHTCPWLVAVSITAETDSID